jgi:fluoroquinolone resistance protein
VTQQAMRHSRSAKRIDPSPVISSRAHYVDQTFRDARLEPGGEIMSSEFHDCVFVYCSLGQSILRHCRFVNCVFRDSDLSLVQVPGSKFTSTRFEKCKVVGVNWSAADWPRTGLANPLGFVDCALSHSTFIGLTLPGMEVRDCVALDVDFREADLSGANFAGTDLAQSLFSSTNLSRADFSRARNYRIDPGHNTLKQARFSLPEAMALLHSMDIVIVTDE